MTAIAAGRIDLFDMGAQFGKAPRRRGDQRGDLRLNIPGKAHRRTESDALASTPQPNPSAKLRPRRRQRLPVARIGTRHYIQQHGAAFNVAAHRTQMRQGAERRDRPGRHAAEIGLDAEDAG